ncbi:hypothetical protein VCHA38O209_140026 [Vibrio chagasii]|nr:hypothetical protein VCHA38O209_140026 [Vibrio chagasii]
MEIPKEVLNIVPKESAQILRGSIESYLTRNPRQDGSFSPSELKESNQKRSSARFLARNALRIANNGILNRTNTANALIDTIKQGSDKLLSHSTERGILDRITQVKSSLHFSSDDFHKKQLSIELEQLESDLREKRNKRDSYLSGAQPRIDKEELNKKECQTLGKAIQSMLSQIENEENLTRGIHKKIAGITTNGVKTVQKSTILKALGGK